MASGSEAAKEGPFKVNAVTGAKPDAV